MGRPFDADKRRYIRYEVLEYALVNVPNVLEPVNVVVVNIGLGGLQVRSRESLPVGQVCHLHIPMIDRPSVVLPGEIRHSVPVEGSDLVSTGIRFRPKSHEDRIAIAEYVHAVFQRQCDLLVM
ncbi:MAG TPA: PilZ domain-containing protein [Fimbriimonas sp.]|nr:PilZ domain-containing protein [Fimbriimonas sp.]